MIHRFTMAATLMLATAGLASVPTAAQAKTGQSKPIGESPEAACAHGKRTLRSVYGADNVSFGACDECVKLLRLGNAKQSYRCTLNYTTSPRKTQSHDR